MRKKVVRALKELDALAVENPIQPGTPDVNFVEGWLELKWMEKWPVNCNEQPVKIRHFTPQQRVWLRRRFSKRGNVFLLFKVSSSREWFLFKGDIAAKYFGKVTRTQMYELAHRVWVNMKDQELLECMKIKN